MKKLMVAVVSAASAIFAFGDDFTPHGADFEANGYTVGANFTNYLNKADDGVATVGARYWQSSGEEIGNIAEYTGTGPLGVDVVPDYFTNAVSNGKYLQLDSGKTRLLRNIASDGTGVSMSEGEGVYLDTLVKFSAASSVFAETDFEGADKLAIEYVGELDDGTTLSNFVIRAGFIGNEVVPTNYTATAATFNLDLEKWYRLTVRALTNIDGNDRAGFKIYLDGQALAYTTDNDGFAKSAGFVDDTHTIFPSAVASGVYKETISAVAFSGNGGIDDVVFTTETPKFIKDTEPVVVTFTAEAGVTNITVEANSTSYVVDMNVSPLTVTLPARTTAFTVTAMIDEDEGYTLVSLAGGNSNPANISEYDGSTIAITTTRNNFSLFDENGDPISGTYTTLGAALAAQGVAKIQLAYDYTVADWETIPENAPVYEIDGDVVLDLNGNTLDGGASDDDEMFFVSGAMTVIDSVGGGKIVYGGTVGMFYAEGDLAIGDDTGDMGVCIDGVLFVDGGEGDLVRANVSVAGNTESEALIWTVKPTSACAPEPVNGYWVVTPKQIIGTYQVTVTPNANATYAAAYNDGGAAVEFVNGVAAVTVGKTITITATPGSGYEYAETPTGWTAGQDGKITIEVSAEATVVIPAPTAASSWPQPSEDTPAAVDIALEADGFSTATGVVTNKVEYDALIAYVEEKTSASSPEGLTAAQKANAVLCYALQASAIPVTEIVKEDVTIDAITTGDDGAVDLTVAIDGVTVGASVPTATLAKIVTAKGGVALGSMSTDNVTVSGHAVEAGKVKITVTPEADSPTSFFTSVIINK